MPGARRRHATGKVQPLECLAHEHRDRLQKRRVQVPARDYRVHADVIPLTSASEGVAGKPPVFGKLNLELRVDQVWVLQAEVLVRQKAFRLKPVLELLEHVADRPVARVFEKSGPAGVRFV